MCSAKRHVRFTAKSDINCHPTTSELIPFSKMRLGGRWRAVLIRLAQHQIGVLHQDLQKTKVSSRNEFFCSKKFNRLLKERPQVLELVEQVPDVIASAF